MFNQSFVLELDSILRSVGQGKKFHYPEGSYEIVTVPFAEKWKVVSVKFASAADRSKVICTFRQGSREVRAAIYSSDFVDAGTRTDPSCNTTRYSDNAISASVLLQEAIITREPSDLPEGEIAVRPSAGDDYGSC